MQGYRAAAPPHHLEVKLGPLPLRVIHLIPAALVGIVGLLMVGWIVQRVVHGPSPITLRCSRAQAVVTCEEWQGRPMILTQRASAAHGTVQFQRISGKTSKVCVAIGNVIMCGGAETKGNVARIMALEPGQTIELDATDRSATPILVSSLFAALIAALTGVYLSRALNRRSVITVRLTPTTLEALDKRGGIAHSLIRSPGEEVHVVQMRSGRGEGPKWEVCYGDKAPFTAITSFHAKDYDLGPLAAELRRGLAALPPPFER